MKPKKTKNTQQQKNPSSPIDVNHWECNRVKNHAMQLDFQHKQIHPLYP